MSAKLTLYPELIAAAISLNKHDLLVVYHVAKRLSVNGSGIVKASDLKAVFMALLGCKERHAQNRILAGDQIFWYLPKKASDKIGLRAEQHVVDSLAPTFPASKPCEISFYTLIDKRKPSRAGSMLKSTLLAILASKGGSREPVSIKFLAKAVNHSERTIIRWLKDCSLLAVTHNFVPLQEFEPSEYAEVIGTVQGSKSRLTVDRFSDAWVVSKQIANSYETPLLAWLGWRQRCRALRYRYALAEPYTHHEKRNLLCEDNSGHRFWEIIPTEKALTRHQ